MKLSHQKLKMMYLAKILMEQTDEEHTITVPEMIAELSKLGISAERKSIYDDLEYLQLFGLDICSNKTRTTNYYIASRDFELPELKLLVDSIQSSKFITRKKSMELISKIEKLTSHENAKKLQRQVFITNRVKTVNEQIYYNVDKIHEAIAANKQITFKYFNLDVNKKKVYRKDGGLYTESPVALTWDDENYYLVAGDVDKGIIKHFRVDKMSDIEIENAKRDRCWENFDVAQYSKEHFSMFHGDKETVTVRFKNHLIGVVIDRFGKEVFIVPKGEEYFDVRLNVQVSNQFFGWITGFAGEATIISPQTVIDRYKEIIEDISKKL